MDLREEYRVEVRAEGSEKTLILIDKLREEEASRVFDRLELPTRGKGYVKVLLSGDLLLRTRKLK